MFGAVHVTGHVFNVVIGLKRFYDRRFCLESVKLEITQFRIKPHLGFAFNIFSTVRFLQDVQKL